VDPPLDGMIRLQGRFFLFEKEIVPDQGLSPIRGIQVQLCFGKRL